MNNTIIQGQIGQSIYDQQDVTHYSTHSDAKSTDTHLLSADIQKKIADGATFAELAKAGVSQDDMEQAIVDSNMNSLAAINSSAAGSSFDSVNYLRAASRQAVTLASGSYGGAQNATSSKNNTLQDSILSTTIDQVNAIDSRLGALLAKMETNNATLTLITAAQRLIESFPAADANGMRTISSDQYTKLSVQLAGIPNSGDINSYFQAQKDADGNVTGYTINADQFKNLNKNLDDSESFATALNSKDMLKQQNLLSARGISIQMGSNSLSSIWSNAKDVVGNIGR